jgi:hypothetical protein
MRDQDRHVLAADRAERLRQYDDAMAAARHDEPWHLEPAAVTRCTLCDTDGYRPNGTVCDHVDHAPAAARGMEKVRAALSKLPKS